MTHAIGLVDSNDGTCILLHLLDNLSARANNGTDELLRNIEGHDAGNLRFELCARLGDSVGKALQDVLTTSLCLHQGFLEDLERQTVALDIHLGGGQTVLRTGGLEVHVAEVVLVAENVGEDGVLAGLAIADHTHGHTSDGLAHRHASVHQGEGTGTDSCH